MQWCWYGYKNAKSFPLSPAAKQIVNFLAENWPGKQESLNGTSFAFGR
jgi:hypothetical protein